MTTSIPGVPFAFCKSVGDGATDLQKAKENFQPFNPICTGAGKINPPSF